MSTFTPDPADVELVARALCDLAYGSEDDHVPWNYTEYGTECACGAAIIDDQDRCNAKWDYMSDEGKDNHRREARAVLSALATEGRLLPADAETRTEWGFARWAGDPAIWQTLEESARDVVAENRGFVLMQRQVWVGPWLPAPTTAEETP